MKRYTLALTFLPFVFFLLFLSCKKNDISAGYGSHSVFIVGNSKGKNTPVVATLWKNEVEIPLGKDSPNYATTANALFVADTNVYVAGSATNERGIRKACYWINGVFHEVDKTEVLLPSYATSIFVAGTDVFIAGTGSFTGATVSAYCKNGVAHPISTNAGSIANGITVDGDDVYAVGIVPTAGISTKAVMWKNGVQTDLSTKYLSSNSSANAIFLSGNNLYIGGDETDEDGTGWARYATIWKNGVASHIGKLDSIKINSIFVFGNDIYAGGGKLNSRNYSVGAYWKNGVGNFMTVPSYSPVNSIFVIGSDVYTAGETANGAVFTKNNDFTYVRGTVANAIYVK